jgi:uncharacterized protein (TIGR03067 family)
MRTLSLVLLSVLCLAFAPAPFRRPDRVADPKYELHRLQGEWVRVSLHIDGKPSTASTEMSVTGTRMQFGSVDDRWDISIDPRASPRRIDLVRTNDRKNVFRGIYRLDGDSLTVCARQYGSPADRPTTFDSSARGVWFEVYKRKNR